MFKFWVNIFPVFTAGVSGSSVPKDRVFLKTVVRRQIKSATEPPNRLFPIFVRSNKPQICMSCWNIGVIRMNNNRYSHRPKAPTHQLRSFRCSRRRKGVTFDRGKIHPSLFKDRSLRQNFCTTKAKPRTLPFIFSKFRRTICSFKRMANTVLEAGKPLLYTCNIGAFGSFSHKVQSFFCFFYLPNVARPVNVRDNS